MIERIVRFRWALFALLLLVSGALVPGAMSAAVPDNALTVWFLETDPQLETYREFQAKFGNDEVILMLVDAPEGVFTPEVLAAVAEVSKQAAAVDGVARVHSVLTLQDAWETDDGLVFQPLIPTPIPSDPKVLRAAGERAKNNPIFRNRVIDEDATQTMLWIQMDVMADIDAHRDAVVAKIRDIGDDVLGPRAHAIGGLGVIYSGLNVLTQADFGLFLVLAYVLMFLMMWWVFRSGRIVLAAVGIISIATVVAVGLYGYAGHQLNMVSVVIPTLVIILGVADAVHMPTAFVNVAREFPAVSREEQLTRAVRRTLLPAVLTTVTTMAGFLALASSPMATIRHLGIYSAIGVGVALFATFVLMPLVFARLTDSYKAPEHRAIRRGVALTERLLKTRALPIAALTSVIIGLCSWGASLVVTDTYTIGYLPDDYWVVEHHNQIEESWGNYSVVDFMIRPTQGRTVRDPEVIAGIERFVDEATKHELIRNGTSLADVYRRMAEVYSGGEIGAEPLTAEQVEQLSLFIEPKSYEWDRSKPAYRDNFLAPFMVENGSLGRLTLTGEMISAKTLEALLADLDRVAQETMGGVATVVPAGYPPLYVKIIDYIMTSQIRGFFIALVVIFLIMLVGLRSVRLALISLPSNVFPVLVMMGVMGAFDLTLDVATATVGAIVIGVAIDDTVHFLHHWKEAEKQGMNWSDAVSYTLERGGTAAVITTILLLGGFPILMFASLKTVFYFGLLTTVAAAAALYGDLFILPLLLRLWPARRNTHR